MPAAVSEQITTNDFLWEIEGTCISLNYTSSLGVLSCMAERASEAGKIRLGMRSPISTPKLGPLDPNSPPGFERCLSISSASTRTVILDVPVFTDSAPSKPHLSPPHESTKSESASFMETLGRTLTLSLFSSLKPAAATARSSAEPKNWIEADKENDAQTVAKALHAHRKKLQMLYKQECAIETILRTRGSQLSAYQITAIKTMHKEICGHHAADRDRIKTLHPLDDDDVYGTETLATQSSSLKS